MSKSFVKIKIVTFLLLLGSIISLSTPVYASFFDFFKTKQPASNIEWQPWSEKVFLTAQQKHKLVFLYAKSSACHWCQKMTLETFSNHDVIESISTNFIPAIADLSIQSDVFRQYHLYNLPAILIFSADQQIVRGSIGYIAPEKMLAFISITLANKKV